MSFRWFNTPNTSMLSASERSKEKRQETIYNEIHKNIQNLQNANPTKKNGLTYNKNTKINNACDVSSNNFIEYAVSYDMLNNVTQGIDLLNPNPVHVPATLYESSCSASTSNRCFKSFNTMLSSSESSREKRQKTIYNELQKNIQELNTANPTKKNGLTYNKNTKINPTCDISNGYVETAASYDILNNVNHGADLVYPNIVSTPKYESWCGNLYSTNYSKHDITFNISNNNVTDPSNVLFYDACGINYTDRNKPEQWTYVVDLSFQGSFFAQQASIESNTYAS